MNDSLMRTEIERIKDEKISKLVTYAVNNAPEYFFHVAASSSGKYHPSYALGEGGLLRHVKAASLILEDLFQLECFEMSEEEQDICRAAIDLHDIYKQGKDTGHTVFEHPVLASQYVKECNAALGEVVDETNMVPLCNAIESHMGKWNTARYSKTILPKPETRIEYIVHLADFLASRRYLEVKFEDDAYEQHSTSN